MHCGGYRTCQAQHGSEGTYVPVQSFAFLLRIVIMCDTFAELEARTSLCDASVTSDVAA